MSESLSPRELDVMAHATGWDTRHKRDRLHRNHYFAGVDHHSRHVLDALCERGLMENHGDDPGWYGESAGFSVTDAGIALLKRFRP